MQFGFGFGIQPQANSQIPWFNSSQTILQSQANLFNGQAANMQNGNAQMPQQNQPQQAMPPAMAPTMLMGASMPPQMMDDNMLNANISKLEQEKNKFKNFYPQMASQYDAQLEPLKQEKDIRSYTQKFGGNKNAAMQAATLKQNIRSIEKQIESNRAQKESTKMTTLMATSGFPELQGATSLTTQKFDMQEAALHGQIQQLNEQIKSLENTYKSTGSQKYNPGISVLQNLSSVSQSPMSGMMGMMMPMGGMMGGMMPTGMAQPQMNNFQQNMQTQTQPPPPQQQAPPQNQNPFAGLFNIIQKLFG